MELPVAWCEEQGVDSVAEIRIAKAEDDFVAMLGLKPLKAKVLRAGLPDARDQGRGQPQASGAVRSASDLNKV